MTSSLFLSSFCFHILHLFTVTSGLIYVLSRVTFKIIMISGLGFVSFLCHNGWESNLFLVMSRNSVIEVFMLCTFFNLYIHTNVHCANKVLYQRKKNNVLLVKRLRTLDDDQTTSSNGYLLVRIINVQLVKQLRVDMATKQFPPTEFCWFASSTYSW